LSHHDYNQVSFHQVYPSTIKKRLSIFRHGKAKVPTSNQSWGKKSPEIHLSAFAKMPSGKKVG